MPDSTMDVGEALRFECPFCGEPLLPTQDGFPAWLTCPACGEQVNMAAQEAFARAHRNYLWAQEWLTPEILNPRRRLQQFSPQAKDVLRAYQQAYTGLQLALRAELPAAQREKTIEMMAEMSRILHLHQMVSGLETKYWIQLMVCQTALQEYEEIGRKLRRPHQSLLTRIFRHPHWHLRRFQLMRALDKRRVRLLEIERELAFIESPRTHIGLFEV